MHSIPPAAIFELLLQMVMVGGPAAYRSAGEPAWKASGDRNRGRNNGGVCGQGGDRQELDWVVVDPGCTRIFLPSGLPCNSSAMVNGYFYTLLA